MLDLAAWRHPLGPQEWVHVPYPLIDWPNLQPFIRGPPQQSLQFLVGVGAPGRSNLGFVRQVTKH
jgi:hypothetical protein